MMRAALLAMMLSLSAAAAQDTAPPDPIGPGARRIAAIEARLAALAPQQPEAYYLLAEEVMQEAVEPEGVALARQLLLGAYALESEGARRRDLMASICLAIADLERVDSMAAWLRALAGVLDPRHAQIDWNVSAVPPVSDEAALGAARAVSLVLAGEGNLAMELLSRPDVRAVMRRYEPLLSVTGLPGGLDRLERYARRWPCPECRNERVVTRVGPDGPESVLCNTCHGNPGPQIDEAEYLALLRFQGRMLQGVQRSWSAEIIASGGAPLLDPDPAQFLRICRERYGLDPHAVLWRDGAWQRPTQGQ
ncbi:MAG: hypothetical protein ACF8R7_16575 [Phycisphaerales bacterium JB039]